jgi:hypothetical protein
METIDFTGSKICPRYTPRAQLEGLQHVIDSIAKCAGVGTVIKIGYTPIARI